MYIQQLYTGCLSEAAYYIESEGEAAIVDPMRDIDAYLELASQRGARIRYIFETHFHADFVSGHLDLSKATGAPIIYGPGTVTRFPVQIARDGQEFQVGQLRIRVLHTPGHTLESSCYLLYDEQGREHCIFTGDTLFVGDVGRPDLAQKGTELTTEDLAGMLYDSLQRVIMPLPDDVIVYPAHGPGSSCGKNLGPETVSTIGREKQHNYALRAESRAAFIREVTEGLPEPPQYFPVNAQINKEGYESLDQVLEQGLRPLDIARVRQLLADPATILLDTRPADVFAGGFIPDSINIGLDGRFAEWAGSLLPFDRPLLLVTEPGKERESVVRLARVGFAHFAGYVDGGYPAWKAAGEPIDLIVDVEADELMMDIPFDSNLLVVDVRKPAEFAQEHLRDAVNIPLEDLTDPASMANLDERYNIYVHCQGGYRSMIALSLLKRQGLQNVRNVHGGFNAIKQESRAEIVSETIASS